LTGGRDGKIYTVDIENEKYSKIFDSDKIPITCLCSDEANDMLWIGTPDSKL